MSLLLTVLGVLVIIGGIVSLVLPVIPGVAVIYLGIMIVAWADDFTRIGPTMLMIMLGLMLVAMLADNVASMFGARRAGASGWGVAGAGIGAIVGIPFGLIGLILGPAIGALTLEFLRDPDARRAARAGVGGLFGFVLGVIAKSVFGFFLVGLAILAYMF
jgi:uncharacterized protein YqgC (DUF456 family)